MLRKQQLENDQELQKQQRFVQAEINLKQLQISSEQNKVPFLGYFIITPQEDDRDVVFSYTVINQKKAQVVEQFTFNSRRNTFPSLKKFIKTSIFTIYDYINKQTKFLPIPVFQNDDNFNYFKTKMREGFYEPIYMNYISSQNYISEKQAQTAYTELNINFVNQQNGHTEQSLSYISAIIKLNKTKFYFNYNDTMTNLKDKLVQSKKLIISDILVNSGKEQGSNKINENENLIKKSTNQKQYISKQLNSEKQKILIFQDKNEYQEDKQQQNKRISNMMKALIQSEEEEVDDIENSFEEIKISEDEAEQEQRNISLLINENKQPHKDKEVSLIYQNNELNFDEVQQMKQGMLSEYLNASQNNKNSIQGIVIKYSIDSFTQNTINELKSSQNLQIQEFQRRQEIESEQFEKMLKTLKEEFDKKQGIERNQFQKLLNQQQDDCSSFLLNHLSSLNNNSNQFSKKQ